MSTHYNDGSHYENHQRAAELHDLAAHAHRAAEQHGQQDHLTGHEHSRQAFEHTQKAHEYSQQASGGNTAPTTHQEDVAAVAHQFWMDRGCPDGSPQQDWFNAVNAVGSRSL